MHGTKIGFMRDVLSETKMCLKQNEVNHMEVPHYQEISVKNMYEDALKDELLVKYLPSKEQLSGRLPERDFFFGVLCTLRHQYMKDIVAFDLTSVRTQTTSLAGPNGGTDRRCLWVHSPGSGQKVWQSGVACDSTRCSARNPLQDTNVHWRLMRTLDTGGNAGH